MTRKSFLLFVLAALVSLSGFVAGWLYREGPSVRAFFALALTAVVVLVAGTIAARLHVRARLPVKTQR
jgi:hypothetical protein